MLTDTEDSDRKQFEDLRNKQIEISKVQIQVTSSLTNRERTKRNSELTLDEIKNLDNKINLYHSIGRTFILASKDDVLKSLDKTIKDCENEIVNLTQSKSYVDKQLDEATANITEFLKTKE